MFLNRSNEEVGVRIRVRALDMLSRMVLSMEVKDAVVEFRRSVSTLLQRRSAASRAMFFSRRWFCIWRSAGARSCFVRVLPPTTFRKRPEILLVAVPRRDASSSFVLDVVVEVGKLMA